MLAAPRFLPKAWNLALHITFINQFRGCQRAERGATRYDNLSMSWSIEIPACASLVFAGVPEDFQSKILFGKVLRPGIGVYQFPSHHDGIKRLSSGDIDFGRSLRVQFTRTPGAVLAYDWQEGTYRTLDAGLKSTGSR